MTITTEEQIAEALLPSLQEQEKRLSKSFEEARGKDREEHAAELAEVRKSIDGVKQALADHRKRSLGGDFKVMKAFRDTPYTEKESQNCYSLARMYRLQLKSLFQRTGRPGQASEIDTSDCGYELEAHRSLVAQGVDTVDKAQQHVGTGEDGGIFVPREVSSDVIGSLNPLSVAMQVGVPTITGVSGYLSIPKKRTSISPETLNTELPGSLTPQSIKFDDLELRPRPFGASVDLSWLTVRQTAPAVEAIVRQDMQEQLALHIDFDIFKGSGQNGRPTGISNLSTSGTDHLNTVSWSGAVFGTSAGSGGATTYDTSLTKLRSMFHEVRKDNALTGSGMAFVGEPETAFKFETALNRAGSPMYVGMQQTEQQRLIGIPFHHTTNLNNAAASAAFFLFGVFSNVIHPVWGGIEFAVTDSDGSKFQSGTVSLRAIGQHDVGVRHARSFCLASAFDAT